MRDLSKAGENGVICSLVRPASSDGDAWLERAAEEDFVMETEWAFGERVGAGAVGMACYLYNSFRRRVVDSTPQQDGPSRNRIN